MEDRRFIEETFPVREIGDESAKEKNIGHGHIATLHVWWARRPLASSRAMNYAALIPAVGGPKEQANIKQFMVKLCSWGNSSNEDFLGKARLDILQANRGKAPKVLDPFAGGGAIPLEAVRLGCEVHASDYNPVATLILKCTLEYPQKYSGSSRLTEGGLSSSGVANPLIEDVRKWANWIGDEVKKDVGRFYPVEDDGSVVVGYVWSRLVACQNPSCNAEVPLIRQLWLARNGKRKVALYPVIRSERVEFKIVGSGHGPIPKGFDPDGGTISKAIAKCLVCGSSIDDVTIRKLFTQGKSKERMLAVISREAGVRGKRYRIATDEDLASYRQAERYLEGRIHALSKSWGIDPIPDEPIHTPDNKEYNPGGLLYNFTPVLLYGKTKWADLFNSRQKLSLVMFVDKVRKSYQKMTEEGYDKEYAKAVMGYLGLLTSRLSNRMSSLAYWYIPGEKIQPTFVRQALAMVWDYLEMNPLNDSSGGWEKNVDDLMSVLDHLSILKDNTNQVNVSQLSATSLSYEDDSFDAIFTDPPYYDNVPYSDLSDYFYVWLKRALGEVYTDLFSTPLTPKSSEIIAELPLLRGMGKELAASTVSGIKTSEYFEKMLHRSFSEIRRLLRPNGVCVLVYAHKSTSGWESLVNSLLDSGLVVTGAWPIRTEMKGRLRAKESAALASSIYMVARKSERSSTGFYTEVRHDLRVHLGKKLDSLWQEGISGPDFFIAAIGSGMEVFGKYDKIIDDEGTTIRADRFLEDIRKIVTEYAVRQVLHNGIAGEISPLSRFYVLWRWAYGDASVKFDDAHKLAQGVGIDLPREWNKGFIRKEKELIEVSGPDERDPSDLDSSTELIDVMHHILRLWKKGKFDEATSVLRESSYGKTDVVYRVAQAISESLPNASREKKLLEGFLAGKERITKDLGKETGQTRLFE
ncbi:MAG: DUF1156 domain-containing protein [Nitrososphaerota archaeon]|nr:DUF1156 domain-containing protein [Nitrososphaerota archaeon]